MSLAEEIIDAQRRFNAWLHDATPEERGKVARNALRQMPGQAYLFACRSCGSDAVDENGVCHGCGATGQI